MNYRNMTDAELRSARSEAVEAANVAASENDRRTEERSADVIANVDAEFQRRDRESAIVNAYANSPGIGGGATGERPLDTRALDTFVRSARVGESFDTEVRAVLNIAGGTPTGGATIPTTPGSLVDPLIWVGGVERLARRLVTSDGSPMPIPVTLTRPAFAAVAEMGPIPESNGTLRSVNLTPQKFAAIAGASFEMLSDSALNVVGDIIVPGFRNSWRITAEAAVLNGTNVSGSGILGETAKVTTAATAAITGDEVIKAFHALPSPYRAEAVWVFSPATFEAVRKLKDTDGNYLVSGLSEGTPRLLGRPVLECPQAPDMATGVTFGAFVNVGEAVTVRYVQDLTIERSDEWKWDQDIASFRARVRYDAAVINGDAVVAIENA